MKKGKKIDTGKGPPQLVAQLLKSTEETNDRTPVSQKLIGREI